MRSASGECSASTCAISVACLTCSPCGSDLADDPPLLSLPGVETPTAQHQIAGAPRTDDPADPRYPARGGQDADTDLGESENRCGIGDPDVGGECELQSAAQAVAGDCRDGRLRQRGEHLVHRSGAAVVVDDVLRRHATQFRDIRAGREHRVPAGDDDGAAGFDLRAAQRAQQLRLQVCGQRIALVLALQRHHRDIVVTPNLYGPNVLDRHGVTWRETGTTAGSPGRACSPRWR